MTKDEEHLRLLSIFHFVVAGMTALFALFPIIHLLIGLAIVSWQTLTSTLILSSSNKPSR